MGLPLWKHAHLLRRFSEPTCSGGYAVSTYTDMYIMANIQTPSRTTSTAGDGDYPWQVIKVFTETQINTADDRTGTPADWIWFQDKWFECRTSRHSNDTFLHHWTAEFVEIASQPPGPLYFYTCGTTLIVNGMESNAWVEDTSLYLLDTADLDVSTDGSTLSLTGAEITEEEWAALEFLD